LRNASAEHGDSHFVEQVYKLSHTAHD